MTDPIKQSADYTPKLAPAVVIGNLKVIHRPGLAFEQTKVRLANQGFQLQETDHFLLARTSVSHAVILVHHFTLQEIDNNITDYLTHELGSLIISDQAFGQALRGVVHSVMPYEPMKAWNLFSMNTLQRLREKLHDIPAEADLPNAINAFASVYHRLFSLKRGSSLLDAGCACAFWPILVAERESSLRGRIVGVDSRRDAVNLSTNLAALTEINGLEFLQLDILTPEFAQLGTFDTVTAIHMLEHLSDTQLPQAFENLLNVTGHRLIVAVPYEQQATAAYGHEQVFTPDKLEQWGQWCVERIGNNAHYWCEEVAGGLLVIDLK